MNVTPMAGAVNQRITPYRPGGRADAARGCGLPGSRRVAVVAVAVAAAGRDLPASARQPREAPRVILRFPTNPDEMLLSGTLVGGQALANRVQLVDIPVGQGHVVSFAIRPFWRWQTQGTYFLAFNAILNWNDLDAGRPGRAAANHNGRTGPIGLNG